MTQFNPSESQRSKNVPEVLFVDEDGNPIEPGHENVLYVDEAGNELSEEIALQLLQSGKYLDSRDLYSDNVANDADSRATFNASDASHSQPASAYGSLSKISGSNKPQTNSDKTKHQLAQEKLIQRNDLQSPSDMLRSNSTRRILQPPPNKYEFSIQSQSEVDYDHYSETDLNDHNLNKKVEYRRLNEDQQVPKKSDTDIGYAKQHQLQLELEQQKKQLELLEQQKKLEFEQEKKQLELEQRKKQFEIEQQKKQLEIEQQKKKLEIEQQQRKLELEEKQKKIEIEQQKLLRDLYIKKQKELMRQQEIERKEQEREMKQIELARKQQELVYQRVELLRQRQQEIQAEAYAKLEILKQRQLEAKRLTEIAKKKAEGMSPHTTTKLISASLSGLKELPFELNEATKESIRKLGKGFEIEPVIQVGHFASEHIVDDVSKLDVDKFQRYFEYDAYKRSLEFEPTYLNDAPNQFIDPFSPTLFNDEIIDIDFGALDAFTIGLSAKLTPDKSEALPHSLEIPSHIITTDQASFIDNQLILGNSAVNSSDGTRGVQLSSTDILNESMIKNQAYTSYTDNNQNDYVSSNNNGYYYNDSTKTQNGDFNYSGGGIDYTNFSKNHSTRDDYSNQGFNSYTGYTDSNTININEDKNNHQVSYSSPYYETSDKNLNSGVNDYLGYQNGFGFSDLNKFTSSYESNVDGNSNMNNTGYRYENLIRS